MVIKHTYISNKGENFLTWDEYLRKNLTNEEYDLFHKLPQDHPEYLQSYKDWIKAEEIIIHKILEDEIAVDEQKILGT